MLLGEYSSGKCLAEDRLELGDQLSEDSVEISHGQPLIGEIEQRVVRMRRRVQIFGLFTFKLGYLFELRFEGLKIGLFSCLSQRNGCFVSGLLKFFEEMRGKFLVEVEFSLEYSDYSSLRIVERFLLLCLAYEICKVDGHFLPEEFELRLYRASGSSSGLRHVDLNVPA